MDLGIASILAQDGLVNGAIYGLVALALVLVYVVTRAIFIPQGEMVTMGALTLASIQLGHVPGTVWLLGVLGVMVSVIELFIARRERDWSRVPRMLVLNLLVPALIIGATVLLAPMKLPFALQAVVTVALVVPIGPLIYRLAYQPVADASVLVLLIISVAVNFVLVGLGLMFFGPEGARTTPPSDFSLHLGALQIPAQSLWVAGASVLIVVGLYLFFERTLLGKSLRATAINRRGAKIVGIRGTQAGSLAFLLAALLGVISGILISPITTVYYDTGFLVGLKAFVGAILAGLVSYPLAAAGAILVGLLESFSSFYASAFKEVIVFTMIIPVLLWRSLTTTAIPEDDE